MALLDYAGDARRAFDVIRGGGIGILPNDVGYSLIGAHASALGRIFAVKRRAPTKLNAMLGNMALHAELHAVSERGRAIVRALVEDFDLPLGLVAPCRVDHPLLSRLEPETFARSTRDGTLLMLLNAGRFHAEITRLSAQEQVLLFGSSANLSLQGTKFMVEDIEPEVRAIADIVVDHGLMKYHPWQASSTLLDCETLQVLRFGSCYENIAYVLRRHFRIELPAAPP